MKKKKTEQLITETEVIFEMEGKGFQNGHEDPTTSLATSTLTHIFTVIDFPRAKRSKI